MLKDYKCSGCGRIFRAEKIDYDEPCLCGSCMQKYERDLEDMDYEKIITIDPGDHIGILMTTKIHDKDHYVGRTLYGDNLHLQLWQLLHEFNPHTIVYERFALRANKAASQIGSTFLTCEVIGIIKLYVQNTLPKVKLFELQPGNKEFCGFTASRKDPAYEKIEMYNKEAITEHVRDTMRLYSYWNLFQNKSRK